MPGLTTGTDGQVYFMGCLPFHCMTLTALIKPDKSPPHESNIT